MLLLPSNNSSLIEKGLPMLRYQAAMDKLLVVIHSLERELKMKPEGPQIVRTESRLKSSKSIAAKATKKGLETNEEIMDGIHDIVGIRIVTRYRREIYQIAERILATPGIIEVRIKDFIKNPKPSGYRGYHLILATEVFVMGRSSVVKVEVQIRDLLMDAWSVIEHDIRYKTNRDEMPEGLDEVFLAYAEALNDFDIKLDH